MDSARSRGQVDPGVSTVGDDRSRGVRLAMRRPEVVKGSRFDDRTTQRLTDYGAASHNNHEALRNRCGNPSFPRWWWWRRVGPPDPSAPRFLRIVIGGVARRADAPADIPEGDGGEAGRQTTPRSPASARPSPAAFSDDEDCWSSDSSIEFSTALSRQASAGPHSAAPRGDHHQQETEEQRRLAGDSGEATPAP